MGQRLTVALLLNALNSEYAVYLWRAVARAAAQQGFDLMVVLGQRLGAPTLSEATQNGIYELVGPERVCGVIVVSATLGHYCGADGVLGLCRSYAPLSVCSIGLKIDGVPSLVVDNRQGMEMGVSHLMDAHHCRHLAFIAGQAASVESNQRLEGFRQAHAVRGLPVDDRLVMHGEFTTPSGAAAMRALLERGAAFDAVVAANDDMALGALEVLQARGLQVPRDILVLGFDDITSSHLARPSLSTLRQPMWWLGAQSLQTIVVARSGQSPPSCSAGPVELVRRESCGCGYQEALSLAPTGRVFPSLRDLLRSERARLEQVLRDSIACSTQVLADWPGLLLDALEAELRGETGRFVVCFESLLEAAQEERMSLDEFQRLVSTLRAELRRVPVQQDAEARKLEHLWHTARVLVGAAAVRAQGRERLETERAASRLGRCGERLAATLSLSLLRQALLEELPELGIRSAAVSLYEDRFARRLVPLLCLVDGRQLDLPPDPFPDRRLGPEAWFEAGPGHEWVVVPLTFEAEWLGVAVLEGSAPAPVYESLRQQIGSAIKGALLHRQVVAQVALRERFDHERLTEEARLAAEIQTSINPSRLEVPGLQLAAVMIPAAEVGGDYYDVIAAGSGGWLGMGDVTGHGLGAGLMMLMLQSMVASLVRMEPEPRPSQVIISVNQALYDNVRQRLRRDDHASLVVLRYYEDGSIILAGAHEPLLVWRAAQNRCELVSPGGVWVGAIASVRRMTQDSELRLQPGDLLVLYTDGVTEARNARQEQFGLDRLTAVVTRSARQPVSVIRDRIVQEVRSWSSSLDDDLTLLVARYTGRSGADQGLLAV